MIPSPKNNNRYFIMTNNTFFGFKSVSFQEKTKLVRDVFASVASKYDLMNDLMSIGMHRLWKKEFIAQIPDFNGKLLDMASGTGDIARKYYDKAQAEGIKPEIIACDASAEMLKEGRNNAVDAGILDIQYQVTEAEKLLFEDTSFDYYTVAFGVRNFTDIPAALKEAYRVLKPGGKFLCLEFSHINTPILEPLYDFYSMNIIPFIGKIVAQDEGSYRYLVESIKQFPTQEDFKEMIEEAGFKKVNYINLTFGTVAIHTGYKI